MAEPKDLGEESVFDGNAKPSTVDDVAIRAAFTPGPWRIQELPPRDVRLKRRHWAVGQVNAPARGVGLIFSPLPPGDDVDVANEANAHLIAAAPDLYAAAKEAAILLPSLPVDAIGVEHVIDLLNAALAKAVPGTDARTSGTRLKTDES